MVSLFLVPNSLNQYGFSKPVWQTKNKPNEIHIILQAQTKKTHNQTQTCPTSFQRSKRNLQEMRDIQKDRQAHFAQLVANDGRAKAFQMAAMGYKTFKDDPAEAQKYRTPKPHA